MVYLVTSKHCFVYIRCSLQYPGKKGKNIEDFPEVPAYLRVMIWFGLEEDQMDWTKRDDVEGDFSVFAETVSFASVNRVQYCSSVAAGRHQAHQKSLWIVTKSDCPLSLFIFQVH